MANQSEKVISWLESEIKRERESLLPKDSELALLLGVSEKTVKRVMVEFKRAGKIKRISGHGTYVKIPDRSENSYGYSESTKRVTDILRELIHTGKYKRTQCMPSLKELCLTYKISKTTAANGYKVLLNEGLVYKSGKSFWVGNPTEKLENNLKATIYLFYSKESELTYSFSRGLLAPSYIKMHNELVAHRFVFKYKRLSEFKELGVRWIKNKNPPKALLFLSITKTEAKILRITLDLFLKQIHFLYLQPPRILYDWSRGHFSPLKGIHMQQGHISTSTAKTLAAVLHGQGIGKVSFFAAPSEKIWYSSWVWILLKMETELLGLDNTISSKFNVIPPVQTGSDDPNLDAPQDQLQRNFKNHDWLHKYGKRSMEDVSNSFSKWKNLSRSLKNNIDSDVWIFIRDETALLAIKWAKKHGIAIPRRLKIISLDNNPLYFKEGISSCIPDHDTIGYLMAHAIIGDFPVAKTKRGFIKTKALMLERLTT